MSLKNLKKKLTVDQTNILTATVICETDNTVRVRTRKGQTVDALKSTGDTYNKGDQVEIRTDGRTCTVTGAAPLASLAGKKIVTV